jgi:hypothetical protein
VRLPLHARLAGGWTGHFSDSATFEKLIHTLPITIFVEGIVVLAYCIGRDKPIRPVLLTSICANIITQSLLWLVLNVFFQQYLITLLVAEILIWGVEGIALHFIRANQLRWTEAWSLSFAMNLASFAIGWFLP